jgi:sortase A
MITTDGVGTADPPAAAPHRPGLGLLRRSGREVGLAMVVAGIIVLLFVVYQLFGTTLTEQRDQRGLARSFHHSLTVGGAPAQTPTGGGSAPDSPTVAAGGSGAVHNLSPSTPPGSAIEHLVIPRIGLDKYVVQGTAEPNLMEGPGHYVGTPFPGQKGNAAIAGHRTTYGAPFFRLNELGPGDRIYITNTKGRTCVYSVVRQLIAQPTGPSAAAVLADTPNAQLTLTTCNPRFEATNRLVVVADLVGRPVTPEVASPTLPVRASSPVAPTEKATPANLGNGTTGGWPPALGFGAAVVVLWILTRLVVARTRRWARAGSLLAGIAACAVPLWFCFENVVRILPQSI